MTCCRLRYRHRRLRYRHRHLRYHHHRCLQYHLLHAMLHYVIGLHESPASSSFTGYGLRCRGSWGRFIVVWFYPSFLCSPHRHRRRCRYRRWCCCCRIVVCIIIPIRWGVHPVGCSPTPLLGWYHLVGVPLWHSKPIRGEVWCWVLILRWFARLGLLMSLFPAPALSASHPDMVCMSLLPCGLRAPL
jgi:hypothetical protein